MTARQILPLDADAALLVGRVWDPESGGPRVVSVRREAVFDHTPEVATVSELMDLEDPSQLLASTRTAPKWELAELVNASLAQDGERAHLLSPIDLQVVKACGVTFVDSMIERVI